MVLKQIKREIRKAKLERVIKELENASDTEEAKRKKMGKLAALFSKNGKEYLDISLSSPDLLKKRIYPLDDRATTFVHGIAQRFPRESVALFGFLKEPNQSEEYLSVLESRDGFGDMAGVEVVNNLISQDSIRIIGTVNPENGFMIGLMVHAPQTAEATPLKKELVESIRDNPKMEAIFKMNGRDGRTIAHIWSDDQYLGRALLNLTKDKPFFKSIMELESKNRFNVGTSLALESGVVGEFINVLENAVPKEVCSELLRSEATFPHDKGHVCLAHVIAAHGHSSIKFDKLLRKTPDSEEIYGLESDSLELLKKYFGEDAKNKTVTVRQILRKNIEKLQ